MALKDDLITALEQRAGLDRATAERAADTCLNFLRERAPEPVRQFLEGGGLSKGLGGIFGS